MTTGVSPSAVADIECAVTFLFVPGTRDDRYVKAVASGADLVVIDLEDAVAPEDKSIARERVAGWLAGGGRAVVRVNGIGTPWFLDDLAVARHATGMMLPKAESADDLDRVSALTAGGVPIIPLIETARGVLSAVDICGHPDVARIGFGNIDLAADLGVEPTARPAMAAARSHLVYASRAVGRAAPVDGVTTSVADLDALVDDVTYARQLGFAAKLLIHPAQVAPTARAFRPTEAERAWAAGVLDAVRYGVGVHDGHMVDEPVLARARHILRRGRQD